jgi:hypothetical protein
MVRAVEIIVIIAVIVFSFFLGVKYSGKVKTHLGWLENQEEQEIDLPDMSGESTESNPESDIPYSPEDEGDAGNISNVNASEMQQVNSSQNSSTVQPDSENAPAVNESEEVKENKESNKP